MKIDIFISQKIINILGKYLKNRIGSPERKWDNIFNSKSTLVYDIGDNIFLNLYKDSIISKLIYNGFEKKEIIFLKKFLKPNDTFFDIGANIGLFAVTAAQKLTNGKVFAFEPTVRTFEKLQENILLNNFSSIIDAVNIGASNRNEKLTLNVSSDGYDAWNSFVNLQHVELADKEDVKVTRLDSFIEEKDIDIKNITLIKIDVEGWELNVLKGMDSLLEKENFNPIFLIEFTEENAFRAGYSCRDIYQYLVEKGYEWFDYDDVQNILFPSPLKAYYPYENLIAVKTKNISQLLSRIEA